MFQEDLERRIHGDKEGRLVNDSMMNNLETQSHYFKHSGVSGMINDSRDMD